MVDEKRILSNVVCDFECKTIGNYIYFSLLYLVLNYVGHALHIKIDMLKAVIFVLFFFLSISKNLWECLKLKDANTLPF